MIITIAGLPGSGKSTAASGLAKKLGMKHYSIGDFRREMAKKRGMTINEYNKLGEEDFFTDREADQYQRDLGKKEKNFVIDSRLGFHFIPNSIKVFLNVKTEKGAKRILKANREVEKMGGLKEAVEMIKTRQKSDIKRYKQYYNLNPFNHKHYDIVIDTTNLTIQETVDRIAEEIKKHKL